MGCVGKIANFNETEDGRITLILQGISRFKILSELINEKLYREFEVSYDQFKNDLTGPIYDDHRALYLNSNIPAINIIDFDYPHWHTLQDIPENCSEESLKVVGNVICEYLYRKNYENE